MAYTPVTWTTGDTITEAKLDNMTANDAGFADGSNIDLGSDTLNNLIDAASGLTTIGNATDEVGVKIIAKARAFRATTQALNAATYTKIQLASESYDVGSDFDSATNFRFVAPVTGYYLVTGGLQFDGLADATRHITAIYKNGTVHAQAQGHMSFIQDMAVNVVDVVQLNATEYVELYGRRDDAGNTVGDAGGAQCYMAVHLLST